MTRFGEISQLWPKVNNLRQIFEGLCGFWQNVELTLVKFNVQEQSFIVTNGQILKNNLAIWSHWTWASICSEEAQCFISNRFFGNTLLLQKKKTNFTLGGLLLSRHSFETINPRFESSHRPFSLPTVNRIEKMN